MRWPWFTLAFYLYWKITYELADSLETFFDDGFGVFHLGRLAPVDFWISPQLAFHAGATVVGAECISDCGDRRDVF